MISSLSLLEYHTAQIVKRKRLRRFPVISDAQGIRDFAQKQRQHEIGQFQLLQSAQLVQVLQSPESEALRSDVVEILRQSTTGILPACLDAITAVLECIRTKSSGGWFARPSNDKHD